MLPELLALKERQGFEELCAGTGARPRQVCLCDVAGGSVGAAERGGLGMPPTPCALSRLVIFVLEELQFCVWPLDGDPTF